MASEEEKEKHKSRRKRNVFAKILFDPNEYKGAYSIKVIESKQKYKREKINPREVNKFEDMDE